MINGFKFNVIFKSLMVLILGSFIFEFVFNVITGKKTMNSDVTVGSSHHGSSGNIYELIVNGLLVFLIKLLVLLLLIILIAGVLKLIKDKLNSFQENLLKTNIKISNKYKMLIILFVSVVSIIIVLSIFNGFILGSRASNNLVFTNMTNIITLKSYSFLNVILNIIIYSVSIILGFELFFYLRRIIGKFGSIPSNIESNELVRKENK